MKFVSRSQWGARYGRGPTNITPSRGGVAIHWEGPKMGTFPHSSCDDKVRGIERYHVERNGWAAIAYTLLVCLSLDNTEVLTRAGWRMLADIDDADEVASWSPDSGTITFDRPLSYVPAHEAEVVKVHHWEMTPDHRMFTKDYRTTHLAWKERRADEVKRGHVIPAAGEYAAPGLPIGDDLLRLLVWAQVDGHYVRRPAGVVTLRFHFVKANKIARVRELLDDLGLNYTARPCHDGHCVAINVYEAEWLRANVVRWLPDKRWTWEMLGLSLDQADALLDELVLADGDGERQYYSAEKANVDVIQALCVLHGRKSAITTQATSLYVTTVARSNRDPWWTWSPQAKGDTSRRTTTVGCVETVNGTLIIRQNGKVAIVGNCPHGYVFEGRGVGHRTAANGTNDGNQRYYAVCALLGKGDVHPPALFAGLADAVAYLRGKDAGDDLKPHSHFFATECPGDKLRAWIRDGANAPEEDDMPTPGDLWSHEIDVPWGSGSNPEWQAKSILVNSGARLRNVEDKIDRLTARVEALWRLDELPAPGYNPDDPFDPDNPGFDPTRNPTWAAQSFLRQTIQGLLVLNGKVDALAARLDAKE